MHTYLKWGKKTITNFSDENINSLYNEGYLFTREGKGQMCQTRSLRIDLAKFRESSENRRILSKVSEVLWEVVPIPYIRYDWSIAKLAKDFYETKFGPRVFTANKVKELITNPAKSNFNTLLIYSTSRDPEIERNVIGYAIGASTNELLHYSYPFYELNADIPNLGLGMMLIAIIWAKDNGKKYIYLGSFSRPADTYKLQFEGLEWWNGKEWKTNLAELKNNLRNPK